MKYGAASPGRREKCGPDGEQSEGVLSIHTKRRGLDARFFSGLIVIQHGLEALSLSPSEIHAHEHLGPVLRVYAARAGMNRDDGVARIIFAGEEGFGLDAIDELLQACDFALQVAVNAFTLANQLEVRADIIDPTYQFAIRGKRLFDALFLAHDLL
jgi:hypothetical protein